MILRAAGPASRIDAAQPADHAAISELAARVGAAAAAAAARWLDDEGAAFDVLRDAGGEVRGYLCTIALDAGGRASHADPVLDACAVHLRSIGWFEPSSAPDARALVFRDWTVASTHQAPSSGTAQLIAHMAARLVTTPGIYHAFLVTDRPEPWQPALRALGLEPAILVEPRLAGRGGTVIAADLRRCSVSALLDRLCEAAAARDDAPLALRRADVLRSGPVPVAFPKLVMPPMTSPVPLATSTLPALSPSPPPKTPAPRRAEVGTRSARKDAALPEAQPAQGAVEPEGTLEQRIERLARSAALSPREHEVLQLLLLGRNYAEIGTALQITPRTARFHQHNILEKIGAESRLDIVRLLL
jgi:DNA-binding CsgD family transcriptional regulator